MPTKIIAREPSVDAAALRQTSSRIVDGLLELQISHAVGVADNMSRFIYEQLLESPTVQVVPVCREGEAWAVASGLWVGGRRPVVIIQNTGFLESGDALRGTAVDMGVPLLALIGYRGWRSLSGDSPDTVATLFEPTLRAWEIPYQFLEPQREAEVLRQAQAQAQTISRPVAVLMR
ncbi:MAG: thiamine pyrophosphate-binding protein [Lentisphaeria bacterium]|jgi:sulfopyruvate decarboxylase TPP-binding subunit|nr:thiamine pyrophosphate-binding protein [Lentisphaeria bacterium]